MTVEPDSKQNREKEIFLRFAQAAQLLFEMESVKNELAPKPDISCCTPSGPIYFELGQILYGNHGKNLAMKLKHSKNQFARKAELLQRGLAEEASTVLTAGRFPYPLCEALGLMLREKLTRKHYVTNGKRAELLVFYDVQSPFEPIDEYLFDRREALAQALLSSVFSRIWFFDCGVRFVSTDDGLVPTGDRVMGTASMQDGALHLMFDNFYPELSRIAIEKLRETILPR
jgi:chaperonin cofactor prefoldin